jgi:hypothetical protein
LAACAVPGWRVCSTAVRAAPRCVCSTAAFVTLERVCFTAVCNCPWWSLTCSSLCFTWTYLFNSSLCCAKRRMAYRSLCCISTACLQEPVLHLNLPIYERFCVAPGSVRVQEFCAAPGYVSIHFGNTETNLKLEFFVSRKKPKKIELRLYSVQTEIIFCLFWGHPYPARWHIAFITGNEKMINVVLDRNHSTSVVDHPDGSIGYVRFLVSRIRILPLSSKKSKKNLDLYCFVTFLLFIFEDRWKCIWKSTVISKKNFLRKLIFLLTRLESISQW